ncbi:MAG: hypothetical protein IJI22_01170 [Bacilli bacterium]|nr:hypothetical protein [Bacilli bacterium]
MAKLNYDATLVNDAIQELEAAKRELADVDSRINAACQTIASARGIEYVNYSAVAKASGMGATCEEVINEVEKSIEERVEMIKSYNQDVDKAGLLKRLFATHQMASLKLTEGVLTAGEEIVDGFASAVGFVVGLFSKKGQEKIGQFVEKNHVGDYFKNAFATKWQNIEKYSYMGSQSVGAKIFKGIGTVAGYTAALAAGGAAVGALSGAGAAAGATAAIGSLKAGVAVAAVGGLGTGTQAGLQGGMEYNQAFGYGVKTAAISAASVVVLNYAFRGAAAVFRKLKGNTGPVGPEGGAPVEPEGVGPKGPTGPEGTGAAGGAADGAAEAGARAGAESAGEAGARAGAESAGEAASKAKGTADTTFNEGKAASDPVKAAQENYDAAFKKANDDFAKLQKDYTDGKITKEQYKQAAKNIHPDTNPEVRAAREALEKAKGVNVGSETKTSVKTEPKASTAETAGKANETFESGATPKTGTAETNTAPKTEPTATTAEPGAKASGTADSGATPKPGPTEANAGPKVEPTATTAEPGAKPGATAESGATPKPGPTEANAGPKVEPTATTAEPGAKASGTVDSGATPKTNPAELNPGEKVPELPGEVSTQARTELPPTEKPIAIEGKVGTTTEIPPKEPPIAIEGKVGTTTEIPPKEPPIAIEGKVGTKGELPVTEEPLALPPGKTAVLPTSKDIVIIPPPHAKVPEQATTSILEHPEIPDPIPIVEPPTTPDPQTIDPIIYPPPDPPIPEPTPVPPPTDPTPVVPEPTPVVPEPTPVVPEPTPVVPEPTPVVPEPTPTTPTPTSEYAPIPNTTIAGGAGISDYIVPGAIGLAAGVAGVAGTVAANKEKERKEEENDKGDE